MNTEKNTIDTLLKNKGLTVADAVRLALNILDARGKSSSISPIEFCHKVIESGKRGIHLKEMKFSEGLELYIESKKHLRPDTFRDIKYLSKRLLKSNPDFANRNFSEFSPTDCEAWLNKAFPTPSQFNKARAMLHALFEFALRHEWCERNIIKLISRKKVIEKEIKPLTFSQTRRLLQTAQKFKDCAAPVAIMTLAGVRPREVRRLKWRDIDLEENAITVRSQCSKTGGVRQVEICPALKNILNTSKPEEDSNVCKRNWTRKWKSIRDDAGFKSVWTQDVLRHTYASFYAKRFHDLPRLQLNMGHRDQTLLRSRYINMSGISHTDATRYFVISR